MGGRYIVTGTELGMLVGIQDQEKRQKVIDEIIEGSFICDNIPKEELIKRARPMFHEEYLINMMATIMGTDMEYQGRKVRSLECFRAQQLLYLIMKDLEEKQDMKLKIPYYWSTHGVRIELNTLVETFPKIKWTCMKYEYENCPYKEDCDFKGKYTGD